MPKIVRVANAPFGNPGRNAFRGPNPEPWDLAVNKSFRITESTSLQFRSEFFNVLNHTNFGEPNQTSNIRVRHHHDDGPATPDSVQPEADLLNTLSPVGQFHPSPFGIIEVSDLMKPTQTPNNPCFSSGPCAKHPGWSLEALKNAAAGRSHRAKVAKNKLAEVIDRSRKLLGMPADYVLGIVPASDTGAVEMAMWSMLGQRGVDVLAWESFSSGWASDCKNQLRLTDLRTFKAGYGELPDLAQVDWQRDVVFAWNGTTSGVKLPNGDWIAADRAGLAICDATSAVFAMDIPWDKLDVVTWSWQKVLGGEGAHGMIALSPRAVQRLETYTPDRPLPKIFQMTKGGKLIAGIFAGETINTPSMLCVEDALDGLQWAESVGGLAGLMARSQANLKAIEDWVAESSWAGFLAKDAATRSNTSICLVIKDQAYTALPADAQEKHAKSIISLLDKERVAYDIGAYRDAPAGLRIWGGATVETSDLRALLPWLDWAYAEVKKAF